jgi:hypothetical protein
VILIAALIVIAGVTVATIIDSVDVRIAATLIAFFTGMHTLVWCSIQWREAARGDSPGHHK